MGSWIDQELAGCKFADVRLEKRFSIVMELLSEGIGRTIPLACGDWAATKAAYRFLDNDRVSEAEILAGHFQATRLRFDAIKGPVLVLHDTTEFSYTRENAEAIGLTHRVAKGHKDEKGRQRLLGAFVVDVQKAPNSARSASSRRGVNADSAGAFAILGAGRSEF